MKNFVVFNTTTYRILRSGACMNDDFDEQAKLGEEVIEGAGSDVTQKVVDGEVVDKTLEEIEADNPLRPVILFEKQAAQITNEQWNDVLSRLTELEKR